MSTKQNALHQSTLVKNNNPSTFEERMARLESGNTLEENKPNKMTDEDFKKKFGFSPNTRSNAKGVGKRKSKRRRSTKRRRGLKRRK
jgi:hypothetical protein